MPESFAQSNAGTTHLLSQTRGFIEQHLEPCIRSQQINHHTGKTLLKPAADIGLNRIELPVSKAGLGLPFSSKMAVAQALAGADFGFAMSVINSHNVAEQIARLGDSKLQQTCLPDLLSGRISACTALTEPQTGSDFAAIQTSARPVDGGWLLNGSKAWITNAVHADCLVVYAQTRQGSGAQGIAAFVVRAGQAGFNRSAPASAPVPSIGTGGFDLNHYFCAEHEMLSPPGEAFKDILNAINGARVYVAAMCCGMLERCLAVAADYGNQRHSFGKPLSAHQGWRWQLADAAVDLQAANSMVQAAALQIDQSLNPQTASQSSPQLIAAQTKVFASRVAQRHIASLMHSIGANGLSDNMPFMRHLAAAQIATLVDGSTEMLLERIAKNLTA